MNADRLFSILLLVSLCFASCRKTPETKKPLVIAPFDNVDTLAINDWWNRPITP